MKKFLYSWCTNKIFLALLLFSVVFFLLGVPFTNWWFYGVDDPHLLFLAYKTKSWSDLLYFFYEGNAAQGHIGPSNWLFQDGRPSFFKAYYRPFYHIFATLQVWFFGPAMYPIFLISVFFHAVNAVLIFMMMSWLVPLVPSFFASTLFAFHPQIAYRFGMLTNQHYYIGLFFILLSIVFFKKCLYKGNSIAYFLSCFFFTISLFTREVSVVLPIILAIAAAIYYSAKTHGALLSWKSIVMAIHATIGHWLVVLSFLLLRLWLYPMKFVIKEKPLSLIIILKNKIPQIKIMIYDIFALSWLPWGNKPMRIIALALVLSVFLYFFMFSTKKKHALLLFLCGFLMLWPAAVGSYSPRYLYEAYPFFLAAFALLISYTTLSFSRVTKYCGASSIACMTIFYAAFCYDSFARREVKMHTMKMAISELLANPLVKGRPLCFLGHPADGVADHNAGLLWTFLNNPNHKCYFDQASCVTQADSNVVKPLRLINIVAPHFEKNYLDIVPVTGGYRFTSLDAKKVHFANLDKHTSFSLGEKIIHKKMMLNGESVVTDFTLLIDKKYQQEKPLFVRWNYESKNFVPCVFLAKNEAA